MREPRIPQYMPFRAHRRFNKGFPRLSSSAKGSSLEMKEELRRGHVGVPGGTVTKETLPIIIIKEDNSILPLADRLSVPSLSARIAQEDTESHHVNATTEQHAISHLAGSPSSEHLLGQLDIVTFGGEGSSLEEGELEEGDHLVEIEEKEGEFQPEFNKENRRVLVRNLESGTTPEDVAVSFRYIGDNLLL